VRCDLKLGPRDGDPGYLEAPWEPAFARQNEERPALGPAALLLRR